MVQGGANLSGNVVYGGDAEPAAACSQGTYLMFNPDRRCDGGAGEPDVNPAHGRFSDAELEISGNPAPPSPVPSPSPTVAPPSPSTSPTVAPPRGRLVTSLLSCR